MSTQHTARSIIAACGGAHAISERTGVPYQTVMSWYRRNSIPGARYKVFTDHFGIEADSLFAARENRAAEFAA